MIAARAALPERPSRRPPIVLVHGAASSGAVWTFWQQELAAAGWPSYAVDLRGHGASTPIDLSVTSMADYAADVRLLMSQLRERPVLMGWSLGGLVALIVAAEDGVRGCVALAPSAPARSRTPDAVLRAGVFGPEEYGITSRDPEQQRAMPDLDREERQIALGSLCSDSRYARDDRRAGIVIEQLACPLLIATGTNDRQWPRSRYADLWLPAEYVSAEGASHWGLVLSRRALASLVPAVTDWLAARLRAVS
jgi:pimeloyl-ACP methyl ester carboxylesterase